MEDSEEEELLNLTLSVDAGRKRRKKGRTRDSNNNNSNTNSVIIPIKSNEGMIFRLLQMRELMLRQDHRIRKGVVEDGINNNKNGLPLIHLLLSTATAVDDQRN